MKEIKERLFTFALDQFGREQFTAELRFLSRSLIAEIEQNRIEQVWVNAFDTSTSVKVIRHFLRRDEASINIDDTASGSAQRGKRQLQPFQQFPPTPIYSESFIKFAPTCPMNATGQIPRLIEIGDHPLISAALSSGRLFSQHNYKIVLARLSTGVTQKLADDRREGVRLGQKPVVAVRRLQFGVFGVNPRRYHSFSQGFDLARRKQPV